MAEEVGETLSPHFLSVFKAVLTDPLLLVDMKLLMCCCKGLDLLCGEAPGIIIVRGKGV